MMGLLSLSRHFRESVMDFVVLFHLGFFSIKRSLYLITVSLIPMDHQVLMW